MSWVEPNLFVLIAAFGFAGGRQVKSTSLYQVNDTAGQVQTIPLNNPICETGANTVQLIILD
jgi:hypothetical protein